MSISFAKEPYEWERGGNVNTYPSLLRKRPINLSDYRSHFPVNFNTIRIHTEIDTCMQTGMHEWYLTKRDIPSTANFRGIQEINSVAYMCTLPGGKQEYAPWNSSLLCLGTATHCNTLQTHFNTLQDISSLLCLGTHTHAHTQTQTHAHTHTHININMYTHQHTTGVQAVSIQTLLQQMLRQNQLHARRAVRRETWSLRQLQISQPEYYSCQQAVRRKGML